MSKDIDLNLKTLMAKARKLLPLLRKHASFIALLLVLLVYLFVVVRVSQLAGAEPSDTADAAAAAQIPKVDKNAIEQIQTLEQSNTQVKSFFNAARNNPFSE